MNPVTLGNRPEALPPMTKLLDYDTGSDIYVRVSMKLLGTANDAVTVNAQAFQVDASGAFVSAPDGRASRTMDTNHVIATSSLGDTHTMNPAWVRVVGDYNADTFEPSAPRGTGKPTAAPDVEANPSLQYYDTASGVGYRYDDGEVSRIAAGKVSDMLGIINNSGAITGIDF